MMWLMRLWAARAGEGRPRCPQATTARAVRRVGRWRRASAGASAASVRRCFDCCEARRPRILARLGVPLYKLERWRQKAEAALDGALKERETDAASGELATAMQRIGELSMENELLRSRIERPGPCMGVRESSCFDQAKPSFESFFVRSKGGRFFVPAKHRSAPRAAAVNTGRRPPPKAARSGVDGREHGATLAKPGTLFAPYAIKASGSRTNRGEPAVGRESSRRDLVFGWVRLDPDHEAVIRFKGEAPGQRAHSLVGIAAMGQVVSPPPRIVISAVRECATDRRN